VGHTYQVCLKVAAYDPTNATGGTVGFAGEIESRTLHTQSLTTNGSTNNNLTNLNWVTVCYDFTLNAGEYKFYISVEKGSNLNPTIGIVFDDVVITDKTACAVTPCPVNICLPVTLRKN
jgi:hypothetical protein